MLHFLQNKKPYFWLKPNYLYLFFFITLISVFAHNASLSLWDQDEAAYAGFAKTMIATGDWLIPDFMWSEIHRKPPLHFWNIAMSYQVFGINEFSVRLPSALSIILTYMVMFFWGRKLFGHKIAFISSLVLSTTLLIPFLAKVSVTDATLLLFSTICAFSVLQIVLKPHFKYVIFFWTSFALALLTKGPPIIIFCVVFVFLILILHPNRKYLLKLQPWFFLPLAVLPLFLWGYLAYQRDGGVFINWMIDWYILKRINGSVLGQSGPPGTHILLIIGFFIPYLMFLPKAFLKAFKGIYKRKSEDLLLGCWFVAGWLIYEFSPSKLPAYTIVAHVPLAILIAKTIYNYSTTQTRPVKTIIIVQFSIMFLITLALLGASLFIEMSFTFKLSIIFFNLMLGIGVFMAFKNINSRQFIPTILSLNVGFLFILTILVLPQIDQYKNSTQRVANYIGAHHPSKTTIVIANTKGHPPSLPFYLSLFSKNITEEQDINLMLSQYQSDQDFVFILNETQKNEFQKIYPKITSKKNESYLTDRKGKANYYIVSNK